MKNKLLLLLFLSTLLLTYRVSAQTQQAVAFTLEQAVEYAMQNQPDLKIAMVQEKIAQNQTDIAKTALLLTVNGTVDMRDNPRLPTSMFPGKILENNPNAPQYLPVRAGTRYNLTASADATQPLFDATYFSAVKYAKKNEQYQNQNLEQTRLTSKLAVMQAYYSALLNNEKLSYSRSNADRNQKYYNDAKVKYENGNLIKSDLDRFYLDYLNAVTTLGNDEKNAKASKDFLSSQIGLPLQTELILSDSLAKIAKIDTTSITTIDGKTSYAESRPEYKMQVTQMQMNQLSIQQTTRDYLPKISAYGFIAAQNFFVIGNHWYPYGYLGLKLTVPIFDGFQRKNNVDGYKLQIMNNQNNMQKLKLSIDYEVNNTASTLSNTYETLLIWQKNVALAEDVVKVNQVRFAEAKISSADLTDSENTLTQTQNNYLSALYDFLVAKVNFEKAKGQL